MDRREYLTGDSISTYYLYDILFSEDDEVEQPPYFLTNNPNGARMTLMMADGSTEERWYMPFGVSHGAISQTTDGAKNPVDLTLDNSEGFVEPLFERSTMDYCTVIIRQVLGDDTEIYPTLGVLGRYQIVGYEIAGDFAKVRLSLGLGLVKCTLGRPAFRTCSWQFGDELCGLTPGDGERCDKTVDSCRKRGNLHRFGGFPGLCHNGMKGL